MRYSWVPIYGEFQERGSDLVFKGRLIEFERDGALEKRPSAGQCMSSAVFSGGTIAARISFGQPLDGSAAEIIVAYDPVSRDMLTVGLGGEQDTQFSIGQWNGGNSKWTNLLAAGERANLKPDRDYALQVRLQGSQLTLNLDGVEVLTFALPFQPSGSQVGVYCRGAGDISFSDFQVESQTPQAFVVMQFSSPYDELYSEVIGPVCQELGFRPVRADETYGPGMIIADITKQIVDSKVIIAEITPANPNVYYEVGYSHALNKPTILIADKNVTKLPFDVSALRTLFYENSIGGKKRVEEGLRRYLSSIKAERTAA